jgi:hypothetical protein
MYICTHTHTHTHTHMHIYIYLYIYITWYIYTLTHMFDVYIRYIHLERVHCGGANLQALVL